MTSKNWSFSQIWRNALYLIQTDEYISKTLALLSYKNQLWSFITDFSISLFFIF